MATARTNRAIPARDATTRGGHTSDRSTAQPPRLQRCVTGAADAAPAAGRWSRFRMGRSDRAVESVLGRKRTMSKTLKIFFGFLVALTVAGAVALPAVAANHKFPLCHGKNSTQCLPDPRPSTVKDCLT